ncbi:NAD(P)/FAD-dependent oxidoreductase [Isoptericola sp. NPDC019693]|uniref:NAD(P)/FAD-dependent oxidoreductase n=1 Tax=Isoptericola sp. NPDC019693 TaxID=3364009 RepID=UPI0037AFBDC6
MPEPTTDADHLAAAPAGTLPVPRSVVVVGAGLAGAQTVAALRAHGFDGRITLLGAEGVPPYDRPPLSKELLTRPEPVWLSTDLGVDVEALGDDVRLGEPALALADGVNGMNGTDGVVVTTSRGEVAADAVVLAVGSVPLVPPGFGATSLLHTAADADRLRAALRSTPGLRLVIVGAGWIGAEVAGVAAGAGADVTVLEAAGSPLSRQLGPAVGGLLAGWYADAGVRLRTGAAVTAVEAGGVLLAGGEHVPADLVLTAVGARPASGWLVGTLPLDARGALLVDGDGRVPGHPRVWAVGDVASRAHPVFGTVPGGHWSAALHDPDPTVRAMLGVEQAGAGHAPYVFSQQLGHDLALLGLPADDSPVLLRGTPGVGPWAALYLDPAEGPAPVGVVDGVRTVRAVLLVDSPRDVGGVRRLMSRGEPLRLDLARATDPGVRLKAAVADPA